MAAIFTRRNIVRKTGKHMTEKDNRIKILTISDHPLSPSGVGTQTRYMIDGLLRTGKYTFISIAGAIKHQDYQPQKTEEFGDDWVIYPVDGYGSPDLIRSVLQQEKPDILWFMTDPRFFEWLWSIENEIRHKVPMIYYHVWDNYPYPTFNKKFYDSNDLIATISKVTDEVVRYVSPDVDVVRVPHSSPPNLFTPLPEEQIKNFKDNSPILNRGKKDRTLFFWNNRNARRKQSGSLIWWFKEFLDEVGHENASLLMHTDPKDPHGQDLEEILVELNLLNGEVMISPHKISPEELNFIYNTVDCTINISDAEGFGLSTFESLMAGTPIIVNMTGGLQEQVTDGKDFFGIGIEPASKAIIGSQQVPFIFEDRLNKDDFIAALKEMYALTREERKALGQKGREYLLKDYAFEDYVSGWDKIMTDTHQKHGSWNTRKNYNNWTLKEIA